EIFAPAAVLLATEEMQIAPRIETGVVTVVEGEPRRVISNRRHTGDLDVLLARYGDALRGRVALDFSRRAHDAQEFGWQLERAAVWKGGLQHLAPIREVKNRRRCQRSLGALDFGPGAGREFTENPGMRAIGRRDGDRLAAVGRFADVHVKRHFAKERDAELPRLFTRAAVAEDIGPLATLRAEEVAHVLHDAEDRNLDALEHRDALARVDQRQILGRRDDHGARKRHALRDAELNITRARRHVDYEDVEIAGAAGPIGFAQHLAESRDDHRSAPYDGRFFI